MCGEQSINKKEGFLMEQHGISKLDLKRQNRMQVLKILKQKGPTSRIDIAGTLELTRAAVTIITNEMIEQGIIQEIGEYKHLTEKAPRGRKKILIDINHNYKFVVGVTVEEDVVSTGLSTLTGAVLDKRNLEINSETPFETIFDYVKNSVYEILSDNCLDKSNILGIGMGIFPAMYSSLGINVVNGEPDYSALRKKVEGITDLPLIFDNSVKGTAMANIDFLKNRGPDRINTAFLQYGNSLHFAVTNLNDPIKSYDNRTDFVDKIIINTYAKEVNCDCGRRGCAKSEITPSAIERKCAEVYSAENTPVLYKLTEGDRSKISITMFKDAYSQGDNGVAEVYENVMTLTAVLLNNLYYSTNPQKIVLHNFRLTEKEFENLVERVRAIGGEVVANALCVSIIENKHRFLAGCALAIREFFYTRGGFDASHS